MMAPPEMSEGFRLLGHHHLGRVDAFMRAAGLQSPPSQERAALIDGALQAVVNAWTHAFEDDAAMGEMMAAVAHVVAMAVYNQDDIQGSLADFVADVHTFGREYTQDQSAGSA